MIRWFFIICVASVRAYNQNPKVFVEVDCIDFTDQLVHGFDVHLPQELVDVYLNSQYFPVIYASAIPLRQGGKSNRHFYYREDIQDKRIHLDDLEQQSWYYVCIEFENMHRHQRQGNTSTTCALHRTLDQFGKSADSTLMDVALSAITSTSIEIQLELDVSFPMRLDVHLEQGPSALQSYIVESKRTLRLVFQNLQPGFNYGRVCVRETPLQVAYTAMGRTISVSRQACYLSNLQTESLQRIPKALIGNGHGPYSNSVAMNSIHVVLLLVSWCLFSLRYAL